MQIAAGTWAGGHEQRATQYYNVVGELTGSRIVKGFVCIITIISLVCTGIAQLVAMSTGSYYLNTSVDKRCERKWKISESRKRPGAATAIFSCREECLHTLLFND